MEPTWWDWLTARAQTLKLMGADPELRASVVGHSRPMPTHWARTVGAWRIQNRRTIIAMAEVEPKAFEIFSYRWHLRSSKTVPARVRLVELGWTHVHNLLHEHKKPSAELRATAFARAGQELGILPVEAAVYYTALREMCEKLGLRSENDYIRQLPEDLEDRNAYWIENDGFAPIDKVLQLNSL